MTEGRKISEKKKER